MISFKINNLFQNNQAKDQNCVCFATVVMVSEI